MAKQKIYLGQADGSATPTLVEGLAVDAIVPGSLVERSASGLSTSNRRRCLSCSAANLLRWAAFKAAQVRPAGSA